MAATAEGGSRCSEVSGTQLRHRCRGAPRALHYSRDTKGSRVFDEQNVFETDACVARARVLAG
jgi:hypothetical protein